MITREDVIKPLIFLDIFDYPPTATEVWRFLGVQAELGEVVEAISINRHPRVGGDPGFEATKLDSRLRGNDNGPCHAAVSRQGTATSDEAFLSQSAGRDCDMAKKRPFDYAGSTRLTTGQGRREFNYLSEKKFKIAKRAAWLLHFIPSIKMIAVCNNFYYREKSDIDFFIITAANRLWLTRFFATIILDIFGLRARGKKTADKICLSFYLSENSLNLESVVLKPDDPYFCYWLAFLEPIYGQGCYNKFWEANAWLKNIFPNIEAKRPVARRCVGRDQLYYLQLRAGQVVNQPTLSGTKPTLPRDASHSRGFGICDHPRRGMLEKIAKKIQWWKISPHVKEMAALGDNRVVINDAMLKFHENDRREEFKKKFNDKISEFISSESAGRDSDEAKNV